MSMFDIHPAMSGTQAIQAGLPQVLSDPGASFGKQSPSGVTHIAPLGASNYGSARFTSWDTSQFGANRGAANTRGSFVNWGDNSGTTPPAAFGAQNQ